MRTIVKPYPFKPPINYWATPPLGSSLLNGLKAYYAMEGLTESSGTGLSLTNVNGVTFTTGKVGNAANLVSASFQGLTHVDASAYQPGTGNWSISAWINTTSNGSVVEYGKVINGAANPGYNIRTTGGTALATMADGTNLAFKSNSTTINDGTWHFLAATFDRASNISFYVDNGAAQTASLTSVTGSANDTQGWGISIGKDVSGDWWNGLIDEVGMWNRALNSSEVTKLWNGGSGTTWPFTGI